MTKKQQYYLVLSLLGLGFTSSVIAMTRLIERNIYRTRVLKSQRILRPYLRFFTSESHAEFYDRAQSSMNQLSETISARMDTLHNLYKAQTENRLTPKEREWAQLRMGSCVDDIKFAMGEQERIVGQLKTFKPSGS